MDIKEAVIHLPDLTWLNNKEWYIFTKEELPGYIKRRFGKRELIYEGKELTDVISDVLLENEYKYDKLWEMLKMEWNPLWNVDGTETLTYTKTGSGSNQASGTDSTSSGSDTTITNSERTFDNANQLDTDKTVSGTDSDSSVTYGRKDVSNNSETYTETKERHGNIGVTKTTELINDALKIYNDTRMSFIYTIAHDIVVNIAYMC